MTQYPLPHREGRDKTLVDNAIRAEYQANGQPMPWDEMAGRIVAQDRRFDEVLRQLGQTEKQLASLQTQLADYMAYKNERFDRLFESVNGLVDCNHDHATRIQGVENDTMLLGLIRSQLASLQTEVAGNTYDAEKVDRLDAHMDQLKSLEDRFTALLEQGTAHEKELSAHQTDIDMLVYDRDQDRMELQALKELVKKQASEIASLKALFD